MLNTATEAGQLNLNIDSKTLDACLKTVSNIGSDTYQNICTGQSAVVQWGVGDWFTAMFVASFGVLIVVIIIGFWNMIRN